MVKSDTSHKASSGSPMLSEAERLAKKARKKERKAARLAEAQRQEEEGGEPIEQKQKKKKRKRADVDADIQNLLVPSQTPAAPSQKRKKTAVAAQVAAAPVEEPAVAESSPKKRKKQQNHAEQNELMAVPATTTTETVEERKKRKCEKRRSDATAVEVEAGAAAATTDAEEPSPKKSKKAKKHAAEKTPAAEPLPTADAQPSSPAPAAESPAARKARKAEKKARKERRRLKAEAAARKAAESVEPQTPKASTSKLAQPARRTSFVEEDVDAIFAAAQGPPRKPAFLAASKEADLAPKASTSKGTAADKNKSKDKGKGKEKSVFKSKGKGKATEDDEIDNEAFKKLCRDDVAMAISSRWMPLKKIKEIATEHNFKYRQGKFTLAEDKIIDDTLEDYRQTHHLTHAELKECILRDRKGHTKVDDDQVGNDLWPTVAMAVGGGRPVLAVYNHVKRGHDPHVKGGPWTPSEDTALETAVKEHGTAWTKISADVGRNPTDCRDRFTKHVKPAVAGKRKKGKWELAEKEKLRGLVKVHGNNWKVMEKLMDGRTATQCRIKWRDSLAPAEAILGHSGSEADDKKPKSIRRWSRADRSTLIHVVAALKVKDVSEIDWEDVGDAVMQRHGSKNLRDRWRRLRMNTEKELGIEDSEESTHAEVVAHLLKCHPVRGSSSKARKPEEWGDEVKGREKSYKSAQFIEDSDDDESSSEDEESD